jgi:hypothetical protein
MGSSQSQPTRRPIRDRPPHPPRPTLASTTSTSSPSSRFPSLRRLSTFGRRESQKRDRAGSSSASLDVDQKKRRVDDREMESEAPISSPTSPLPLQHGSLPTAPGPPVFPTIPSLHEQTSPLSPPLTTSTDPLFPERLRMLSTIQDTLGPEWPAATVNPSIAHDRLRQVTSSTPARQLRRQSYPSAPSSSTLTTPAPPRLTDRFCSFLGISPATPPNGLTQPADEEESIAELTERLSEARTDLERHQRELDEANATLRRTEEMARAAREAESAPSAGNGRIPAGAVLVIQGGASQANGNVRPTLGRQRSSSESHAQGNRAAQSQVAAQASSDESLETQARMISGLLT